MRNELAVTTTKSTMNSIFNTIASFRLLNRSAQKTNGLNLI